MPVSYSIESFDQEMTNRNSINQPIQRRTLHQPRRWTHQSSTHTHETRTHNVSGTKSKAIIISTPKQTHGTHGCQNSNFPTPRPRPFVSSAPLACTSSSHSEPHHACYMPLHFYRPACTPWHWQVGCGLGVGAEPYLVGGREQSLI